MTEESSENETSFDTAAKNDELVVGQMGPEDHVTLEFDKTSSLSTSATIESKATMTFEYSSTLERTDAPTDNFPAEIMDDMVTVDQNEEDIQPEKMESLSFQENILIDGNQIVEDVVEDVECNKQSSEIETKTEDILWYPDLKDDAIYPTWAFGFNQNVPVINLSKANSHVLFYASAHLLILFDVKNNRQRILRGHCNEVTCLSASADKRWLASGDRGPDSAVVVWDGKTGNAVRTMLAPYKNGVVSIALTRDARYLAMLSADECNQEFSIWNWTNGLETPLCSVCIKPEHMMQTKIAFKTEDYYHLTTNSDTQVIFYSWTKDGKIVAYAPPLTHQHFNKKIGTFSCTRYLPEKNAVVTATSQGLLVVWETDRKPQKGDTEETPYKKASKLVPLHDKSITFMTIAKCYPSEYCLVTGDAGGQIKFFDLNFMLLFWYQELKAGPINFVDFADSGLFDEFVQRIETSNYPECATIAAEKFVVENFIVSTAHATMIAIKSDCGFLKIILRDNDCDVTGITCHPKLNLVAVCSYSGMIKIFDYDTKNTIAMRNFTSNNPIQCCRYDPRGLYLALGFVNGDVRIVDSITLNDVTMEPFSYGRGAITHVDFGPQLHFCAYADSAYTTTLLKYDVEDEIDPWTYVARVRVHNQKICDLLFWQVSISEKERLFTLGEDRILAEYSIHQAKKNSLPLLSRYRIEQLATPLCLTPMPPFYKENFVMIATDASKLKLFNASSFMCRKTVCCYPLGIQFHHALALPSNSNATAHFMICMSDERLALVMLPLDGDPLKSTNIMAHPKDQRGSGHACSLTVSTDGQFAFTAGGPDSCAHMWHLNPKVLEDLVNKSGQVKRRFYAFLTPEFLEEIKDYFYYSMLRIQGLRCLEPRQTLYRIPITEIPFVMRAIGYYPTEEDVECMINEIKYSTFCETGEYLLDIDLDQFIQMYCNHRPFQGVLSRNVETAFNTLTLLKDIDTGKILKFRDPREENTRIPKIPPEEFFEILQTIGEPITESEMSEYLASLLGLLPEGGKCEFVEPVNEEEVCKSIDRYMPMFLNAGNFISKILGMRFCVDEYAHEEWDINMSNSDKIILKPKQDFLEEQTATKD